MSGFEVAGIVLGSIPLLVVALKKYAEGLSTLHRWRKYKRELQSLIRNLETEKIKLQNVCEKLLLNLVPYYKIEALIDNPMGDLWKEKETVDKIQYRLGKGFKVFEDTVNDLRTRLTDLEKMIDSPGEGLLSGFKRAVFTLSRSQYAEILSEITQSISNLENLIDRNMELEPSRRLRSKQKLFTVLRTLSESLYRALRSSLICSCGHDIGLRLETRMTGISPSDDEQKIISSNSFKISVSYANHSGNFTTWEDFQVQPQSEVPAPGISATISSSPRPLGRQQGKKKVRFSESSWGSSSTAATLQQNSPVTTIPQVSPPRVTPGQSLPTTRYFNLCSTIRSSNVRNNTSFGQIPQRSSGIIRDYSSSKQTEFSLLPMAISPFQNPRAISIISLRDILKEKERSTHLTIRDRHYLAVVVSSSLLQLHSSPWLSDHLTSHDIWFFTYQGYPIFKNPLLIRHFPDRKTGSGYNKVSSPPFTNPALWSLGLLLIELILGKTLDSETTNQPGSRLPAEYFTAYQLLNEVRMVSSNYQTAVTRCLGGELHSTDYYSGPSGSADFCQDVYAGVVALLEKDLENS